MNKFFLFFVLAAASVFNATADEGMWLPSLIYKLNIKDMQSLGCELSADAIYNINNSSLKDAVVALDRGNCTAELVSANGLLLTNHHCGEGEIQKHSSVEHNYLKDGFWAKTLEEELPNPGKTVTFLIRVEEVTGKVMADVTADMKPEEQNLAIRKACSSIEKNAVGDTHYEARVQPLFNGNKYYLFVSVTYRDVRLVGCPPESLGKFGGDTDNWMWPRHTADFCIFRVYTGPDGKPASYSKENKPLKPKFYFSVSLKGVEEGDFAMVMGYPGKTDRYITSWGINFTKTVTNDVRIAAREKKLDIIKKYMETSPKATIQYTSKYNRSSNYYKYSIGQNKGLKDLNVVAKKEAGEKEFTDWVNADAERSKKYGSALKMIKDAYADITDDYASNYMNEAIIRGPEIFAFANRFNYIYKLLDNPEKNKDQIKQMGDIISMTFAGYFKDYDAATDEKVTAALLKLYFKNVDPRFYPSFFNEVDKKFKGDFDKYAQKMFATTIFTNQAKLEAFLKNPSRKVLDKDLAFKAATSAYDKQEEIRKITSITDPMLEAGIKLYMAGMMEMNKNKNFYPNANSTMRLTYGTVRKYDPRDGVTYKDFTTIKGYSEKYIPGDAEFDVPGRLFELSNDGDFGPYADKDGSLHTCFITNNDITGGNSGSPVLNGRGELIGIAFDGNWEAMTGELAFEPELQRCINVDIRFVLWIVDKLAGAGHLVKEMTIVN